MDIFKETLRYLGVRGEVDNETAQMVTECITELSKTACPRYIARTYSSASEECALFLQGKNIFKLLKDTEKTVLFAATLGTEVDRLIKKYQKSDMAKATIIDSAATAYLENYLDGIDFSEKGLVPTARFSPGYGDYPIQVQKVILQLLNADTIGIAMLDSYMLTPSKTVTAVLGLRKG